MGLASANQEEGDQHEKIRFVAQIMRHLNLLTAQWGIQAIARTAGTWAVIEGVIIIMGGSDRWRGQSFAVALAVPGAPASWGVAAFVLGLLIVSGTFIGDAARRVVGVALCFLASWSLFFAFTFGITAWGNPYAATTAAPTYFFVAVGLIILGVIYYDTGRAGPRKEP